ncbi:MAG: ectoine hydroxylase, partial [Candidatus Latescibacteria bacterium]|nr:ectoine hydroxylase [Candidatus Latescibacterota bacterium]
MTLTPAQVQHFQEHGYVAVPQFFNQKETRAIQAEVDRL